MDPRRRRLITAALAAYPLDDVVDAVRGWRNSPHHAGDNDRGTVYNDLGLILRDAAHIEMFRDLARSGPPVPRVGPHKIAKVDQRTMEAMDWAAERRARREGNG